MAKFYRTSQVDVSWVGPSMGWVEFRAVFGRVFMSLCVGLGPRRHTAGWTTGLGHIFDEKLVGLR